MGVRRQAGIEGVHGHGTDGWMDGQVLHLQIA